ncbi:MAG: hypothetical protein HRT44_04455 [Bdellovibrionales bacterium]|nr:hypothetical protein [Bdellovibrionales bacterium]NQZ18495.1 hypothetical protein [Bdellovibrionales bacterium]
MKKIIIISLFTVLPLVGCNFIEDSGGSDSGEVSNVIPDSTDSPTPYPVSTEDRELVSQRLKELHQELKTTEGKLMAPATEDYEAYEDFLVNANTGLVRLFSRNADAGNKLMLVNGNGAYYQFRGQTHEYGYGSDIQFNTTNSPMFSVGFAGVDYGFFGQLGKVDIRDVDASNDLVSFAMDHQPPHNEPIEAWRTEQRRWSYVGVTYQGVNFQSRTNLVVGMTYVLRSINEGRYDVVVVFQVVRVDEIDGSVILAWHILDEFQAPELLN